MSFDFRIAFVALVVFWGCDAATDALKTPPEQPKVLDDAQARTTAITGAGKQCPACTMFTNADAELMLGAPVGPGETTGPLGTMCKWTSTSAPDTYLEIQIIDDVNYWAKRSLDPGYQPLDGIAKEAFVVPGLFGRGFDAQALTDKQVIAVGMNGGSASREAAVAALRTVVDRINKPTDKKPAK